MDNGKIFYFLLTLDKIDSTIEILIPIILIIILIVVYTNNERNKRIQAEQEIERLRELIILTEDIDVLHQEIQKQNKNLNKQIINKQLEKQKGGQR